MSSRAWVKIHSTRWFEGSIRKESIEVRSVFVDLIALAGRTGTDGVIKLPGVDMGYSDEQIATILNIPTETWMQTKSRLCNHPDENENRIMCNEKNVISIINWGNYQSEYCRQKQYKPKLQSKLHKKLQPNVTPQGNAEKEKEKEKEKENTTTPPPSARENWVSKGGAIWERHLGSVNYGEFGKVLKPMFEELGEQKFLSTVESYCVKRNGKSSIRHLASTYKTVMPRVHTGVQL